MSYTKPTTHQFKARFPQLAATSDPVVQVFLNEADAECGETWTDKDRALAVLYLAAHLMVSQGASGASSGGGGAALAGTIKRTKVGDVETEYFGSDANAAASGSGTASTIYGREYLRLMRRNFPGIAVV